MTGWVIFAIFAAGIGIALRLFGVGRDLWTFVGAALMLGAAGYALQGQPMLGGAPRSETNEIHAVDADMTALRRKLFGRFNFEDAYFIASDAMLRSGRPQSAVRAMLGGINRAPQSAAMWTGLGTALNAHDNGLVSPAATMAFNHAMWLAPQHPGPPFYYGLALVRANDFAAARPLWARALALTPPDAEYRQDIALRLALLDRFLAMPEGPAAERQ